MRKALPKTQPQLSDAPTPVRRALPKKQPQLEVPTDDTICMTSTSVSRHARAAGDGQDDTVQLTGSLAPQRRAAA